MFKKIRERLYGRLLIGYPEVMKIYVRYKLSNGEYHAKNRLSSAFYLYRMIRAAKRGGDPRLISPPSGASRPSGYSEGGNHELSECKAIPDTKLLPRESPSELVAKLGEYDAVSFDVFDTLIFRPFSKPTDLFYLVEYRLSCFDFTQLRQEAEIKARQRTDKLNFEVDIYDIYEVLSEMCPLKKEDAEAEIAVEKEVCYANPYMLDLFLRLKKMGKRIAVTSDMYLPSSVIKEILEKNGYSGIDAFFVSNEYRKSKASGELFEPLIKRFGKNVIHLGDSYQADVLGASKAGIKGYHYRQCNEFGEPMRPSSLISPAASMYKGVVNNYLYNGSSNLGARECFGFIYAGPVVVGMCDFIDRLCKDRGLDGILFLARDMSVFYKVYKEYYTDIACSYAAASRFSLQELIFEDYPAEFFRHTVVARCDRGYTLKKTLEEINLGLLIPLCADYFLDENEAVSSQNLNRIEKLFLGNREIITERFRENEKAAIDYFKSKIGDKKRLCVVDLGWRGSVIAYLDHLLVKKWRLCDEVNGVLLGTTVNSTSVSLCSRGTVTPYAYSHINNRIYLAGPDWETEYIRILTLESVFSSEEASLIEYRRSEETGEPELFTYQSNPNAEIIRQFHSGIYLFARLFEKARGAYRKALPFSAVDAFEAIYRVATNYDYISRIIGDTLDTPFAIAGLNIDEREYVPLGELMLRQRLISRWPIE